MKLKRPISLRTLTYTAAFFHAVGLVGIGYMHSDTLAATTPLHMLLMFVLLILAFLPQRKKFLYWAVVTYLIGVTVEWVGVNKQWLFGDYEYLGVLGIRWMGIPLIIGVNWVIVMTGASSLAGRITNNTTVSCMLAATFATIFDWVLEPVAMDKGFWQWANDTVPLWNYVCWWFISFLLALLWKVFGLLPNQFGINLFIIQLVFFIMLNIMI